MILPVFLFVSCLPCFRCCRCRFCINFWIDRDLNDFCRFDGDLRNELCRRNVDRDLNDLCGFDLDLVELDLDELFWNDRDLNELCRFDDDLDLDLRNDLLDLDLLSERRIFDLLTDLLNGVTNDLIAASDGVPNDLGTVVENLSKKCSSVDNGVKDEQFNCGVNADQNGVPSPLLLLCRLLFLWDMLNPTLRDV